jgi:mRNA interferase MazF
MTPARGEVWWARLDPTEGSEIRKTRPCLVITADTLNRLRRTVVVIPYSTVAAPHPPITVPVTCLGRPAVAVIDQVRAIAKERLVERIEAAPRDQFAAVAEALAAVLELA